MAFDVFLYTFSKRKNSTAQPAGGDEFLCTVKEQSGILSPTLGMDFGKGYSPAHFNYAYIPSFNRYYFITEWNFSGGLWWASLSVDVLASWKTQIGASTQYVVRSAAQWDGDIIDNLYPCSADIEIAVEEEDFQWATKITEGSFVLGVISPERGGVGATTYYVMDSEQLDSLCAYLMDSVDWMDIQDISEGLVKSLVNPFQFIASCMWLPYLPATDYGVDSIKMGWWSIPVSARVLASFPYSTKNIVIDIPKHPQSATRGNFHNLSPYSDYMLYILPWGCISLDPSRLIGAERMVISADLDAMTGDSVLTIAPSNMPVGELQYAGVYTSKIGVPIQLAQAFSDTFQTMMSGAQGLGSLIGGAANNDIGGVIESAISGITDALRSAQPSVSILGSNGSIVQYFTKPRLVARFLNQVDDSLEHRGRPLCKDVQISTIPGYIMVADPDVSLPALDSELEQISTFMTGGFYYE